jgi:hypothetical protein
MNLKILYVIIQTSKNFKKNITVKINVVLFRLEIMKTKIFSKTFIDFEIMSVVTCISILYGIVYTIGHPKAQVCPFS